MSSRGHSLGVPAVAAWTALAGLSFPLSVPAQLDPPCADLEPICHTRDLLNDLVNGLLDESPPSAPADLEAAGDSGDRIDLAWSAATDNHRVEGYYVYRDGTRVGSASSTSTSDTGLSGSTRYCYSVTAYDPNGNESEHSPTACATTCEAVAPGDFLVTFKERAPSGLIAGASGLQVPRHSMVNGGWLQQVTTDRCGVANFGAVGASQTSVSILGPSSSGPGASATAAAPRQALSLIGVPSGAVVRIDELLNLEDVTIVDVVPSEVPMLTSPRLHLPTTMRERDEDADRFTGVTVHSGDRQSDGTLSMIVDIGGGGGEGGASPRCGSLVDQAVPAAGTELSVETTHEPAYFEFSANERVGIESVAAERKGVTFDLVRFLSWQDFASRGMDDTCASELSTAERFAFRAATEWVYETDLIGTQRWNAQSLKRATRITGEIPSPPDPVVLSTADLEISLLHLSQGVVASETRGSAASDVDLTRTRILWNDPDGRSYEWTLLSNPSSPEIPLPEIGWSPSDYSLIEQETIGLDHVAGFTDYWAKTTAARGSSRSMAMQGERGFSAFRSAQRQPPRIFALFAEPQPDFLGKVEARLDRALDWVCGTECAGTYPEGTVVDLRAVANPGARFAHWEGDCVGQGNPAAVTMDGDRECVARFSSEPGPNPWLEVVPQGWVSMIRDSDRRWGIKCGWDVDGVRWEQCSVTVPRGTEVRLVADPFSNHPSGIHVEWQGNCTGTGPTTTVFVDKSGTCVATTRDDD